MGGRRSFFVLLHYVSSVSFCSSSFIVYILTMFWASCFCWQWAVSILFHLYSPFPLIGKIVLYSAINWRHIPIFFYLFSTHFHECTFQRIVHLIIYDMSYSMLLSSFPFKRCVFSNQIQLPRSFWGELHGVSLDRGCSIRWGNHGESIFQGCVNESCSERNVVSQKWEPAVLQAWNSENSLCAESICISPLISHERHPYSRASFSLFCKKTSHNVAECCTVLAAYAWQNLSKIKDFAKQLHSYSVRSTALLSWNAFG